MEKEQPGTATTQTSYAKHYTALYSPDIGLHYRRSHGEAMQCRSHHFNSDFGAGGERGGRGTPTGRTPSWDRCAFLNHFIATTFSSFRESPQHEEQSQELRRSTIVYSPD